MDVTVVLLVHPTIFRPRTRLWGTLGRPQGRALKQSGLGGDADATEATRTPTVRRDTLGPCAVGLTHGLANASQPPTWQRLGPVFLCC